MRRTGLCCGSSAQHPAQGGLAARLPKRQPGSARSGRRQPGEQRAQEAQGSGRHLLRGEPIRAAPPGPPVCGPGLNACPPDLPGAASVCHIMTALGRDGRPMLVFGSVKCTCMRGWRSSRQLLQCGFKLLPGLLTQLYSKDRRRSNLLWQMPQSTPVRPSLEHWDQ